MFNVTNDKLWEGRTADVRDAERIPMYDLTQPQSVQVYCNK